MFEPPLDNLVFPLVVFRDDNLEARQHEVRIDLFLREECVVWSRARTVEFQHLPE
jgi:hypothetical protein